jgi:peptide/nickel transport system ATP-binding protein/oligopeptide transport system ATP-binding protein
MRTTPNKVLNKKKSFDIIMKMAIVPDMILRVNDLKTYFDTRAGIAKAVDGVHFTIHQGETLGIVGESGCGKSVTALSIMQLLPSPPGRFAGGEIWFKGEDLTKLSRKQMRRIRGRQISMIFQEPMSSLNPVYTIGDQIVEAIRLHQNLTKKRGI